MNEPARVLLVEDNPDDVALVQRLTAASSFRVELAVARDGREALDHLAGRASPHAGRPELVLLDVGLPALPGLQLLRMMKDDRALREIPVVVVTGSDDERHVREGMELGAHGHVVKPMNVHDFVWMIRTVRNYRSRLSLLARLGPERGHDEGPQPQEQ